ncbi:hypothetical protein WMF30_07680 [Sorangium sp. So ce134]
MMLLATASACDDPANVGTGGGGNGLGEGGNGGDGAGGDGTGGDGTGGDGTGGDGAGGDGTGGDGSGPACEVRTPSVFACVHSESLPPEHLVTATLAGSWTVTAARPADASEPCGSRSRQIGNGPAPEVVFDLVDEAGDALTLGITAPGFAPSAVAVGATLDVDFSHRQLEYRDKLARLRLEQDGELVVAVGENDPIGLTLGAGERACYREDDYCGYEEHAMTVEAEGGPAVSIANGESAEVGALTVTNERYFKYYDTSGTCNFGTWMPFAYVVSAASAP